MGRFEAGLLEHLRSASAESVLGTIRDEQKLSDETEGQPKGGDRDIQPKALPETCPDVRPAGRPL